MSEKENFKLVKENEEISQKTGLKVELDDNTFRLEEMAESMMQSINNARKVANEQDRLIKIINNSDEAEDFKDFVKSVENQIKNINSQMQTLIVRSSLLTTIVKECKNDEKTSKVVSMLLKALGVFENN